MIKPTKLKKRKDSAISHLVLGYSMQYVVAENGDVSLESNPRIALKYPSPPSAKKGRYGRVEKIPPFQPQTVPTNVVGIKITRGENTAFLIRGDESSVVARDLYIGHPYHILPPRDFVAAALSVRNLNNATGMVAIAETIEQHVPEMRFVPERIMEAIRDTQHPNRMYLESILNMLWRYDMSGFAALAMFAGYNRSEFPTWEKWIETNNAIHLREKWFAFKDGDDAVMLKVARPENVFIFALE